MSARLPALFAAGIMLISVPVLAVDVEAQPAALPEPITPTVVLGGYVEAYGAWNFREPADGINAFRAFDNRHSSLTLANVALDAAWQQGAATGKLTLQHGDTPASYYAAETVHGAGHGVAATGPEVWRFIQQAYAGYKAPVGSGLQLDAGVFLSPIGPENIAVKENWNWSRSNLFNGLPFYHSGLRATYNVTPRLAAQFALINGWNSVVDNNAGKTVHAMLTFKREDGSLTGNLLYMGGVERPTAAAEGKPWRHLIDGYGTWNPWQELALGLHGDTGWEQTAFGTSSWLAGAAYARLQVLSWVWLAVRGDAFREAVASNAQGQAGAVFWPARWLSSGTATLDVRPVDHISIRLEYRDDQAASDIFFRGAGAGGGTAEAPFVGNSDAQDTVTLGIVSWF